MFPRSECDFKVYPFSIHIYFTNELVQGTFTGREIAEIKGGKYIISQRTAYS